VAERDLRRDLGFGRGHAVISSVIVCRGIDRSPGGLDHNLV